MTEPDSRRMRMMRLLGAVVATSAMVLALPATGALADQAPDHAGTTDPHPHDGDPHPPDGDPHPPDGDPHPPEGNFTCRASVLRFEGAGLLDALDLEPIVSNPDNDPCVTDSDGLPTLAVGPLTARILQSSTENRDDGATSKASVADVVLTDGTTTLIIRAASSRADVTCTDDQPTFSGSSQVVGVTIIQPGRLPRTVAVGGPNQVINAGAITVVLNEQTTTPDSLTQRAVNASTPLGDLVVAESIADVNGNPCA